MEADWSVELATDDPVIAVPWTAEEIPEELRGKSARVARFIDLRKSPQPLDKMLDEIEEARDRPALRNALHSLNGEGSKFWTVKCDAWEDGPSSRRDRIDPLEMDADPADAIFSAGCYIDLLFCDDPARGSFEVQEHWIRRVTKKLRCIPLRCARIDLVLRRAEIHGVAGFGVTWFVESCGANPELARLRWAEALTSALPILTDEASLCSDPGDATIAKSMGE